MEILTLAIHVIVSITLLLFILLQSGKGGGVSAAFGGGAGAALGQRSAATVLGKATVFLSIIFGVTSMSLAIFSTMDKTTSGLEAPPPVAPAAPETPTPSASEAAPTGTQTTSPAAQEVEKQATAGDSEKAPEASKDKSANDAADPAAPKADPANAPE